MRVAFKKLINPKRPVDGGHSKRLMLLRLKVQYLKLKNLLLANGIFSSLGLLIDAFVKALSTSTKELSAAAHYGDSMVIFICLYDPK